MAGSKHSIVVNDRKLSYQYEAGVSLLVSLERQGAGNIPVGCRGGGCGVCKIRVVAGRYRVGKMAACHVSQEESRLGFALACRVYPESDMEIRFVKEIDG